MGQELANGVRELNIVVAGVGGQGSILLTHIIGNAAIMAGFKVRAAETYGAAIRGGSVHGQIRIGDDVGSPLISEDKGDILVALEPLEGLRVGVKYLGPKAVALVNTRPVMPVDANAGFVNYPPIQELTNALSRLCGEVLALDATSLAERAGNVRTLNLIMLGGLASLGRLPISNDVLLNSVVEQVPKGTAEVNLRAFEIGMKAFGDQKSVTSSSAESIRV